MTDPTCPVRPVPAVAAVIVRDGNILLIKRGKEPSLGAWSIPGGSVELGETLVQAVKREALEETSLEVEVDGIAGVFDLILMDSEGNPEYHYVIIDYFAYPIGGELMPATDAADARWVPLSEVANYELTPHLLERLIEMGVVKQE